MGSKSAIEWTDASWNPTYGCTKVSPACRNCYIVTQPPYRIRGKRFDAHGRIPIELLPERLPLPLTWHEPRRIFVDSLSDLFHDDVPTSFIAEVYATMRIARWHTFQLLTKRPARRQALLSDPAFERAVAAAAAARWEDLGLEGRRRLEAATIKGLYVDIGTSYWPLPNVWEGVTVENQRYADERIPILLDTPAAVRFLSCEPLLGPIDLLGMPIWDRIFDGHTRLDWVIVGGESGPQIAGAKATPGGARRALVEPTDGTYKDARAAFSGNGDWRVKPEPLTWVRSLRDQCNAADVAFHFKQWGGRTSKSGGRALDGRTWDEYPASAVPA